MAFDCYATLIVGCFRYVARPSHSWLGGLGELFCHAFYMLGIKVHWLLRQTPNLRHFSSYSEESLIPTANLMLNYILKPITHEYFFRKYASKKYMKVCTIQVVRSSWWKIWQLRTFRPVSMYVNGLLSAGAKVRPSGLYAIFLSSKKRHAVVTKSSLRTLGMSDTSHERSWNGHTSTPAFLSHINASSFVPLHASHPACKIQPSNLMLSVICLFRHARLSSSMFFSPLFNNIK